MHRKKKIFELNGLPMTILVLQTTYTQHFIRYAFIRLIFLDLLVFCCCSPIHLRGLTHCVFTDALVHTCVVKCGYLHYCHLPVSFDLSH